MSSGEDQRATFPARIERAPSLIQQAENSFRELVAFDEIIRELSGDVESSIVDQWVNNNKHFMSDSDRDNFTESLDKFRGAMENIQEYIKDKESNKANNDVEFSINIPKEAEWIFSSFILHIVNRAGDRAKMISRAFLIAAESSFEVLFGQIARAIYVKNPSALPRSDYSFTLEELSTYTSISDARDFLIEHRIEVLLRESLDEWNKWLKRTINIQLDQIMTDWPTTREIFLRRNMLVHTDGRITERYLRELQRLGGSTSELSIGQSLVPSVDYLRASLQRLIALEVLLVFKVRSRLEKHTINEVAGWLAGKLEFLIMLGMWNSACLISDSFNGDQCQRSTQLMVRINGWLAHKNRDGLDSVREQVSAWDVSGLDMKYSLTKKLLLDELSTEELDDAVAKGIFTQFEISTAPLFMGIAPFKSPPPNPAQGSI